MLRICHSYENPCYNLTMDAQVLQPDTTVAEAARQLLAAELAIFLSHEEAVRATASPAGVYEMRKALRRTFTAVKLFRPYFTPGQLDLYRRPLKKIMRRLAVSRDTAVFLGKLRLFMDQTADGCLTELESHWYERQTSGDAELRAALGRRSWQEFLAAYRLFAHTPGMGVTACEKTFTPDKIGHLAPVLIYQRVAAVRAYGQHLEGLSVERLHQLRIECKELRYTLHFFTPLLGEEILPVIEAVKRVQEHLGDVNDARVALNLLGQTPTDTPARAAAVSLYGRIKDMEINRLLETFDPLWQAVNSQEWQLNLTTILAKL